MNNFNFMEKFRYLLSRVRRCLVHIWMYICRICPVDQNKIVIMNYYGGGFGDNGKAVALKLREKNSNVKIVWPAIASNCEKLPDFCKYVKYRSLAYYYEMATAAVWVDNSRKAADIIKRKNQYYIQTWHGMVPLKRIEKDAQDSLSIGYLEDAKHDSEMANVFLSGCEFFTKLCKSSFFYEGEVLECGSPRLDIMFNQSEKSKQEIRKKLKIPNDKK